MFSRLAAVAGEDMPADKWLVDTFNGISPLVAREIAFRACGAVDAPALRTAETLWAAFSVWRDTVNAQQLYTRYAETLRRAYGLHLPACLSVRQRGSGRGVRQLFHPVG